MRRLSLDKRIAIKSSREFDRIFKEGAKRSSEHILVLFSKAEQIKIGFTVSKKIKGAVTRNRAKRRLRELVRLNQQQLPNQKAYIFFAKPGVENYDFAKLQTEFLNLIEKIRQHQRS